MPSEPAGPEPRNRAAPLASYIAGGMAGAIVTWMLAIPLELHYMKFIVPRLLSDDQFHEQGRTFSEHCAYWSPLAGHFWGFVLERLPGLLCGPMAGAPLGMYVGILSGLWRRWSEIKGCVLFCAFSAAYIPFLLMLRGNHSPWQTALEGPFHITLGVAYGAVLGLTVTLLERWRTRHRFRG